MFSATPPRTPLAPKPFQTLPTTHNIPDASSTPTSTSTSTPASATESGLATPRAIVGLEPDTTPRASSSRKVAPAPSLLNPKQKKATVKPFSQMKRENMHAALRFRMASSPVLKARRQGASPTKGTSMLAAKAAGKSTKRMHEGMEDDDAMPRVHSEEELGSSDAEMEDATSSIDMCDSDLPSTSTFRTPASTTSTPRSFIPQLLAPAPTFSESHLQTNLYGVSDSDADSGAESESDNGFFISSARAPPRRVPALHSGSGFSSSSSEDEEIYSYHSARPSTDLDPDSEFEEGLEAAGPPSPSPASQTNGRLPTETRGGDQRQEVEEEMDGGGGESDAAEYGADSDSGDDDDAGSRDEQESTVHREIVYLPTSTPKRIFRNTALAQMTPQSILRHPTTAPPTRRLLSDGRATLDLDLGTPPGRARGAFEGDTQMFGISSTSSSSSLGTFAPWLKRKHIPVPPGAPKKATRTRGSYQAVAELSHSDSEAAESVVRQVKRMRLSLPSQASPIIDEREKPVIPRRHVPPPRFTEARTTIRGRARPWTARRVASANF